MARTLNIGIDLDGVCSQFEEELRWFAINHKGIDPGSVAAGGVDDDDTVWDFPIHMWGWTEEQFLEYCDEAVDAGVLHLRSDPYGGAAEMVRSLSKAGHRIHIITARSFGTKSPHNTADWLNRHGFPFDSLVFTHQKELMGVDVHLDDHINYYNRMTDVGTDVFLLDRPWNREFDVGDRRVFTYDEFEKRVAEIADD